MFYKQLVHCRLSVYGITLDKGLKSVQVTLAERYTGMVIWLPLSSADEEAG